MSKVVKGVVRSVKRVISGGFKLVANLAKKAWQNKFVRAALITAAVVWAAPAFGAFTNSLQGGATLGQAASAGLQAGNQALAGTFSALTGGAPAAAAETAAGAVAPATTQLPASFLLDPATGQAVGNAAAAAAPKGIMSRALEFAASPGGGLVTSSAMKLAGGAMADRAEAQLRADEIERQRRNTAVGGLNTNWTVGQSMIPTAPAVPLPGDPTIRQPMAGVMAKRFA